MALVTENGIGVHNAESYVSVADADAYWGARTHTALYTTWNAITADAKKEGALREASAYLDATAGPFYKGRRKGWVQGLAWPRIGAQDEAGYPLPDLPQELVWATCELAARAVSALLAEDLDRGGDVKREKVGPLEVEYFEGAQAQKSYGMVMDMLHSILNGNQPGAQNVPQWNWR